MMYLVYTGTNWGTKSIIWMNIYVLIICQMFLRIEVPIKHTTDNSGQNIVKTKNEHNHVANEQKGNFVLGSDKLLVIFLVERQKLSARYSRHG